MEEVVEGPGPVGEGCVVHAYLAGGGEGVPGADGDGDG